MNRNAFYHYKVAFFDDYSEKIATDSGLTAAHSFSEALDNISNYYGEQMLEQVHIDCLTGYDGIVEMDILNESLKSKGALD